MKPSCIFIVHAHHEPGSFNGAMTPHVREVLSDAGHEVVVSDLHALQFDPISDRRNFRTVANAERLQQQDEEALATRTGGYAPDIQTEIDKPAWSDVLAHPTSTDVMVNA